MTVNYFECGQEQTGTITGQCGANQAITLESTGKAAFTGTGSVGCSIVTPMPPPPPNHTPTANAGPDQTVNPGDTVTLDANPATFSWTVLTLTQATQKLISTIYRMQLPTGTTTSLEAPLNAALAQLNSNNHIAACNQLYISS